MTPEAQAAQSVFTYATDLNRALVAHPWIGYASAAAAIGGLLLLRPQAASSVRPSAPAKRESGGAAQTDEGLLRRTPRAVRVSSGGEPPPKKWAVDGLVPHGPRRPWWAFWWPRRGYVTAVVGTGGVGKSYLLLDLALAALTGGEWLGHPVRRVRSVLYIDAELDVEECRRRAYPLARGRGLRTVPRGLHYLSLVGCSLASVREKADGAAVVRPGPGVEAVRRATRRVGSDLNLFDSLTIGATGASLNDQNGWNRIMDGMESWGPPVVVIDHLGKDASRGAVGSFMKQAKVRSMLALEALRGVIRVTHSKNNFGPMADPFAVAVQRIGKPAAPTCVAYLPAAAVSADGLPAWTEDGAETVAPTAGAAWTPPPSSGKPSPTALRVVPRRSAPHEPCEKILGYVTEHAGEGPWKRPRLQEALAAARVVQNAAFYEHLKCLVAAGLLALDADGTLSLPGATGAPSTTAKEDADVADVG